jgi:chromosome segregation ATPase
MPITVANEKASTLPALPQIGRELESYFAIARQMELALAQERSANRRLRDEHRDLQPRYARAIADAEARLKDAQSREDRSRAEQAELRTHIEELDRSNARLKAELERAQREWLEDRKRLELDCALSKSSLDHLKVQEESAKGYLSTFQQKEQGYVEKASTLEKELKTAQKELGRYQAAWGKVSAMDRQARQILAQSDETQLKLQEVSSQLTVERKRREEFEHALRRERREKEIALKCLREAEEKMTATQSHALTGEAHSIELRF